MSLKGEFSPPGDKSICHRLALMSLLAHGETRLMNFSPGADVASSLDAVRNLAGGVRTSGEHVLISGAQGKIKDHATINCGNSGTTMRLLMGILAGCSGRFILDGDSSLRRRPMERVASPLRDMGAAIECVSGACPVTIDGGGLRGIDYELPVASAQLKSAVLLAGIQAEGATSVRGQVPSRDHTERLLQDFRARISWTDSQCTVERSSLELPESYRVPGDISSAAFFLCAATIIPESDVRAEGVLLNPTRTGFLNALTRMGAQIEVETLGEAPEPWGRVRARFSPELTGCSIPSDEIPSLVDEVPILALVAARARGTTVFEGVGELRVKESDRLAAVAGQLSAMGAKVMIESDTLVVHGPANLKSPRTLESFGDHRIAMTLRLASLLTDSEAEIEGEGTTVISYPAFHETLERLWR